MNTHPANISHQVGLDRILEQLASQAAGHEASAQLRVIGPIADERRIQQRLDRVDYFMKCLQQSLAIRLEPYEWPKDFERGKDIEGYVFELTTILEVRALLNNAESLSQLRMKASKDLSVHLDLPDLPTFSAILDRLATAIERDGGIREDATPELAAVHKRIKRLSSKIDHVFDRMASSYGGQGLLSDIKESYRDGRRVLALPAENKRKIQGVLHGTSESGKTVFLEPIEVTEINNTIVELHQERQQLIYALLKELSAELISVSDDIELARHVVCLCDVAITIAKEALSKDWQRPTYDASVSLHLLEMFHPALQERLADQGEEVIKNDLELQGTNRVLVVSGPNAGGKSVLLKTAALCQLMFQTGMPIPASGDSRMRIFDAIHMDIGDQQSIQDDLSTYSAHLSTMKVMLAKADESQLFFIDEMGTGTDPRVGGALAEEMLHRLVRSRATGVVTTHYPNLKAYAHRMKGVVNGSMRFDMDTLRPKYQLMVGKPGSSFAFEIARRIGVPESILKAAKRKTGTDHFDLEKLLEKLEHDKDKIAKLEASLLKKQSDLDQLTNTYVSLKKQLDIERRRLKVQSKEILSQLKAEQIAFFKSLQKEVDQADAQAKADAVKQVVAKLDDEQRSVITDAQRISEEVNKLDGTWIEAKDLQVGDHVKLRQSDSRGDVVEVRGKKARIAIGTMMIDVPLSQLMKANRPLEQRRSKRIKMDVSSVRVPSRMDLRGMSYREAEDMLVQYLDDALLARLSVVEVLHGVGSGALQKLVRKIGRAHPHVADMAYADEDAGGERITRITFG